MASGQRGTRLASRPARRGYPRRWERRASPLARVAGRALAELRLGGEYFVDAAVMATAAAQGGVVYTSDFDDLERLRRCRGTSAFGVTAPEGCRIVGARTMKNWHRPAA